MPKARSILKQINDLASKLSGREQLKLLRQLELLEMYNEAKSIRPKSKRTLSIDEISEEVRKVRVKKSKKYNAA